MLKRVIYPYIYIETDRQRKTDIHRQTETERSCCRIRFSDSISQSNGDCCDTISIITMATAFFEGIHKKYQGYGVNFISDHY